MKTFFKTAYRNIKRRKGFALINLAGLTIGLTISGMVGLYVQHELSYDSFHDDPTNTFRISARTSSGWFAACPRPYSDALYTDPPSTVRHIARFRKWFTKYVTYKNEKYYEEKVLITDPGSQFFDVFNFEALSGNLESALSNPNQVIITESVKQKIFGDADAIGQIIQYDTIPLTVTAVLKDLPSNSHIYFTILFTNAEAMAQASGAHTYAMLFPGADPGSLIKEVTTREVKHTAYDKIEEARAVALQDIHFEANMTYELKPSGNKIYLFIFASIGVLIFVLCCSNYINLSVAIYAERNKEIAIRKVSGARNAGLALQFWGESVLLCITSIPLALDLIQVAIPYFNAAMDIRLHNEFLTTIPGFLIFLGFAVAMGIIAGIYPALIMPRMNCLSLFKKEINAGRQGIGLRKAIVLFQFTLIIILASAAWFVQRQLTYIRTADLGFDKDHVIKISKTWTVDSLSYQRLKQKLTSHSAIVSVTNGLVPGDEDYGIPFRGEDDETIFSDALYVNTDTDYLKTLGIEPQRGEYFDRPEARPNRSVLVNEAMLKRLGYDSHEGKKIILWPGTQNERSLTINGVVRDYHFYSLHHPIVPQMLFVRQYSKYTDQNILVKVNAQNTQEAIAFIRASLTDVLPDIPLQVEFLDDDLNKMYAHENRLAGAINILFAITILLSVAALIGLASYIILLRTKEIGVRKVLGASTLQLIAALSREFILLMMAAFIIGSIASFVALRQWLSSFAYKIELDGLAFVLIGVLALLLILITVSWQSLKASRINPAQSLRNE